MSSCNLEPALRGTSEPGPVWPPKRAPPSPLPQPPKVRSSGQLAPASRAGRERPAATPRSRPGGTLRRQVLLPPVASRAPQQAIYSLFAA